MATEFKLPELGENIETIQVASVLVKEGDTVAAGQAVLEVETDKASLEVPCPYNGIVKSIEVKEGEDTSVGQTVMTIESEEQAKTEEPETAAPQAEQATEAESRPESRPSPPPAQEEPSLEPGEAAPPKTEAAPPPPPPSRTSATPVPAAPSVRRFAREIGVEIGDVPGSGPEGRVSIEDVKAHAKRMNRERPAAATPAVSAPPLPDFEQWGAVDRQRMSGIRRKTAEHLSMSWRMIPHVTVHDTADITQLEPLRKQYADRAQKAGGKLTMAVMVCKVVAAALKVFPKLNASVDMDKREVVYKKYVNLGVAVSTDRGLLVPVIRDADQKNMVQMAAEISRIAQKAREGSLDVSDMQGGTFTVTNLGRFGGGYFTPVINYPEVAILGMGRAYPQAGVNGGVDRTVLPLSLSFDHRVIDGADGAKFLGWMTEAIQQPLILALEG
ncbi:MAG: dihydrolipoamide acetyltransferase family protein [Planctomycetota bacterium]